jgi:hypothetical protein
MHEHNINLDDIVYGIVDIVDADLVEFARSRGAKTVVVTSDPEGWQKGYQHLQTTNVIFSDGDGSKIRGYRARNVYILRDSNIDHEQVNDIISGFLSVSSDPINDVKVNALNKVKRELGMQEDITKQESFQIIWNKGR